MPQHLVIIQVGGKSQTCVLSHPASAGSSAQGHPPNKVRICAWRDSPNSIRQRSGSPGRNGVLHFALSSKNYPDMVDCNLSSRVLQHLPLLYFTMERSHYRF